MADFLRQIHSYLRENIGNQLLNDGVRERAEQSGPQPPDGRVHYRSLTRDPAESDLLYVAADLGGPKLIRAGRTGVEALPFSPCDRDAIRHFAVNIDASFLPRPQK